MLKLYSGWQKYAVRNTTYGKIAYFIKPAVAQKCGLMIFWTISIV